jgi:hypothetical protein
MTAKKKKSAKLRSTKIEPRGIADGIPVFCPFDEIVNADDIVRQPRNPNTHPKEQLRLVGKAIRRFGWRHSLIISNQSGLLVVGEGRLDAIIGEGLKQVPIVRQNFESPSEEWAFVVADNQLPELSELDEDKLKELLQSIKSGGFDDMEATGFNEKQLADLLALAGKKAPPPIVIFKAERVIDEAFKFYREKGFPYRHLSRHVCMQEINKLANAPDETLLNSDLAYHVADTFHPHRFHGHAEGMKSPLDAFNDDKLFKKSLRLWLENVGTVGTDLPPQLCIVSGTQACSNFRPGFALKLYREFCEPGDTVLDTSTGYGGRLLGFIASNLGGRYIGIDPNEKTHRGNLTMAEALEFEKHVKLINLPVEAVDPKPFANKCDFAFTSPPYFRKEHYADEPTQSFKKYPTIDKWVEGFLEPMMKFQFDCLKRGCFAAVNIAPVKLGSEVFALDELCNAAAIKAGFKWKELREFPIPGRKFGAGIEEIGNVEPMLIFRKP